MPTLSCKNNENNNNQLKASDVRRLVIQNNCKISVINKIKMPIKICKNNKNKNDHSKASDAGRLEFLNNCKVSVVNNDIIKLKLKIKIKRQNLTLSAIRCAGLHVKFIEMSVALRHDGAMTIKDVETVRDRASSLIGVRAGVKNDREADRIDVFAGLAGVWSRGYRMAVGCHPTECRCSAPPVPSPLLYRSGSAFGVQTSMSACYAAIQTTEPP